MAADYRMIFVRASGEAARDYRLSSMSARVFLSRLGVARRTADVGAVVLSEVSIATLREVSDTIDELRAALASETSFHPRYREWYVRDCERIEELVAWAAQEGGAGWLVIESADID